MTTDVVKVWVDGVEHTIIPSKGFERAYALAEAFAEMYDDQQAAFWDHLDIIVNKWPLPPSVQWEAMKGHMSPEGFAVLKGMAEQVFD